MPVMVFFTLKGYIATSWFGVYLTSPDSLHTQLDVDKIISEILSECTGIFFLFLPKGFVFLKTRHVKKIFQYCPMLSCGLSVFKQLKQVHLKEDQPQKKIEKESELLNNLMRFHL